MKNKSKMGDCIVVACNNVVGNSNWMFCFAYVEGQGELKGRKILHAWNEVGDVVLDFSNGHRTVTRKEKYYEVAKITDLEVTRQNAEEVRELMLETGTYGGWIK